jgi:putative membrane protein
MSKRSMAGAGTLLALSLAAGVALAAAPQDFVKKAGVAGLYEVRAAELARDKAQTESVREFAGMMLDDHRKANDELRALAKKRTWNVPAELDSKHEELIERLAGLQGADFEREYAMQQLQAHEQAVALFRKEGETGKDPELKAWAMQKLATLQSHLEEAQALRPEATPGTRSTPGGTTAPGDRM